MRRLPFRLTLLLLALAAFLAAPAHAQPEKILDTPAGWTYLYGATSTTINAEVNAGRRPFQIKRVASNSYDVITVANSGDYAMSGFGTGNMHYNRTLAQLSNELTNRRLVSLDCYDISGATYMSAVSIPNSGAQSAGWGWLVGQTRQQIVDWVANASTPLRILDLSIYTSGGQKRYSAIAVNNTGAQAQGWWWYFDVTGSEVIQLLEQNNARLIDIELETAPTLFSPARFAVVMVAQNPGANWVYTSLTSAQVADLVNQNGARLTNLHRYTTATGATRFAVSMVDNADQPTRRLRDLMAAQFTQGSYGFKLKRVGGSVQKSLNESFVFEPASTLKIIHASYAVYQRANNLPNAIDLDDEIWVPNRCSDTYWNNVCPETAYSCNSGNEPLRTTARSMMRASHNGRTRTIEDLFGRTTLNNFASQNGGTLNTQLNHHIGCGTPPNTSTCDDLVRFYERICNGSFFNAAWRTELAAMMQSVVENGWGGAGRNGFSVLDNIINQEAASTNLTAAELSAFRSEMQIAHKIGGYWDGAGVDVKSSVAGWAQIPFKANIAGNWITIQRDYTFALFVSGALDGPNEYIYTTARLEILREQIREALESWDAACSTGIAQQPVSATVDEGEDAQFTVAAGGAGAAEYQWQRLSNGVWLTVSNAAGQYSGATTSTLTVINAQPSQEGSYRCRLTKICGTVNSNAATLTVIPGGATDAPHALPTHLVMHAPSPNPFNPQVTLRFDLPRSTDLVVLEVFDVAGRRVRTLSTASLPAGSHSFTWNGTDDGGRKVASGMYMARLRAGGEQATHRLMLVE